MKIVTGGSLTEALAGVGAVVLAILGLANVFPGYMGSIATILVGVALLAQGGAVAARWSALVHETTGSRWDTRTELGGGVTAEVFGGVAGIVLGILALIGIAPATLISIALLVFGGALLVGSGVTADLGKVGGPGVYDQAAHLAREASFGASGVQILVGLGAIALGIVALAGIDAATLNLVGLLALGASILLSGSAVSSRMISMLRR